MIQFCSTKNSKLRMSLKDAVISNMPSDGGLFMPTSIEKVSDSFLDRAGKMSFVDLAVEVLATLFGSALERSTLEEICNSAFTFDAPLIKLDKSLYSLELFHGPTLAFKDFGVRFMAELLSYYRRNEDSSVTILTATSGDTGGAVASAFFERPGFEIYILFPKGKISIVQEKQISSFGGNIHAIEVDGTFDDCQRLVKQVLADSSVASTRQFISANSINVARLLPQVCYYVSAFAQLPKSEAPLVVSVPSGNFGNLTAGIIAKNIGVPISKFIAATNTNDIIPRYLASGSYEVQDFHETLSSAMDIADPSNFVRVQNMYENNLVNMRQDITGMRFTDNETINGMKELWSRYGYKSDPHGAISYRGLSGVNDSSARKLFITTADPIKFQSTVESAINEPIQVPPKVRALMGKPSFSKTIKNSFSDLRNLF